MWFCASASQHSTGKSTLSRVSASSVPSATALEQSAATRKRLQVIYTPNGMMMQNWTPATTGEGYAITPILKPLEPFRSQMTIVSGLRNKGGET